MPQSPDFRYDVFLSHNTGDKPQVRRLAERLKRAGLRVWFDEWVIRQGDDIYLAIERGLGAARVQVLCLSPAALGSEWVTLERSTVLFRDPTNAGRRFIPLVLADCELPDTLRRYKYVDFREEAEAAFEELLTACRVATEEVPEVSPPTPAETVRPTLIERLLGRKRAEEPPASQPKPKEKKPEPAKPLEETEPLAVLERKLTGHDGWVNSVAVSPDGKWAASGSADETVKIWGIETGDCRATLEGHTDQVQSVAITPDGKRILSASFDNSVRVWDANSGRELGKLDGHTNMVWSVVALQDNARALSGGFDKTLRGLWMNRLWDWKSGACLQVIKSERYSPVSVAFSPDGSRLVVGTTTSTASPASASCRRPRRPVAT
jgi:WD40 repeat protein